MIRLTQFVDFPQLFARRPMSKTREGSLYILVGMGIGMVLGGAIVAALYLVGQ